MMNKKEHILEVVLADNDPDDHFFFEKALKEMKIRANLTSVIDGEQLMCYLALSEKPPDVIFLDINMPKRNGIECLSDMKHNLKLKEIPIVIYSTSLKDEIADTLYKGGAHYYLHKCDYKELTECIQKVFTLLKKSLNRPPQGKFILNLQEVSLS